MAKLTPEINKQNDKRRKQNRTVGEGVALTTSILGNIKPAFSVDAHALPASSEFAQFAKKLRAGDILLWGASTNYRTIIGLGTGTPEFYHGGILKHVNPDGSLTIIDSIPGSKGWTERRIQPNIAGSIAAVRPKKNAKRALDTATRLVDLQKTLVAKLKERGHGASDVAKALKTFQEKSTSVRAAAKELLLPVFQRPKLEVSNKFRNLAKDYAVNMDSIANEVSHALKNKKKIRLGPLKALAGNCMTGLAGAFGAKPGTIISSNDLLRSKSIKGVGTFTGVLTPPQKALNTIIKYAPHAVRGGIGVGLGAAAYAGLNALRKKRK